MELGSWTTIKKQMIARRIDCSALQHISPNCIPNRSLVENVINCILNNSNHFLDPDNVENPRPAHPIKGENFNGYFNGDVCFSPMDSLFYGNSPVGIGLHFQEFTPSVFVKHGVNMQNGLQFDQDADFPDVRQQCLRALALLKYCKTAALIDNNYPQQVTRRSYLRTVNRTATGSYGEDETESFSSVVARCRNGRVPEETSEIHDYDPEYHATVSHPLAYNSPLTTVNLSSYIDAVPLLNYYDWWEDGTPYCEPTGTYVCSDSSTRSDIATLPLIPEASRIENLLMYHASLYCYSTSDGGFSYVSSSEFSAPDGIENTTEGDYITWDSMRDPSTSLPSGGYHKDGLTVGVKSLNLGTWDNRVLQFIGTLPGDLPAPPTPSYTISHHTYPHAGCYYAARSILGYMLLGTIVHKYTFNS